LVSAAPVGLGCDCRRRADSRPLLRTVTFSILPVAEGAEGLQPAALFEMLQLLADPAAAGGPPLLGGYPVAAVPTVPEVEATEAVAAGGEAGEDGPRDIGDGWAVCPTIRASRRTPAALQRTASPSAPTDGPARR